MTRPEDTAPVPKTLGQLWEEFTQSDESRAALKTEDGARLRRFVVWGGMGTTVATVRPYRIEEFLQQQNSSTTSARDFLPSLKALFAYAQARGAIRVDPMKQVRSPRESNRSRAAERPVQTPQKVLLTAGRLAEVEAELGQLVNEERPRVLRNLDAARSDGDLRENSAYDDAKNEQGMIEARVRELERVVQAAETIEEGTHSDGAGIVIGSRVELESLGTGRRLRFLVVSPEETDPRNGKLSHLSPVGKSVMGRKAGETVEVATPRGTTQYQIVLVS